MSYSESNPDRSNWAIHRRGLAVLHEEGIPALLRRVLSSAQRFYRRFVPADPSGIYDADFYRMSRSSNTYCSALARWLTSALAPACVLDVGSGDCSLLLALARSGVSAYGLDGSATAVEAAPKEVTVFLTRLDRPFLLNKGFPLVCCLEVAEHLPRRCGRPLIAALTSHARETIVFSAAHTGQGGTGHINEQPREYWTALFARHGWIEDSLRTEEVKRVLQEAEAPWYLSRNIMVVVKSGFNERCGSHSILQ